jgi:hypothetical protein
MVLEMAKDPSKGGRPTDRDRVQNEARERLRPGQPAPNSIAALSREIWKWLDQQPDARRSPRDDSVTRIRTITKHVSPIWREFHKKR